MVLDIITSICICIVVLSTGNVVYNIILNVLYTIRYCATAKAYSKVINNGMILNYGDVRKEIEKEAQIRR